MKVLTFDSLNLDYVYRVEHFVQPGETLSATSQAVNPGGKGLNQSIALARAGAEVYHAGCLGVGGESLGKLLRENGVDTSYLFPTDELQGNAVIQVEPSGQNCILLFGGSNQCITSWQVDKTLAAFSEGDYLVLQNEVNDLPMIVEKAYERGMKIVLNPSPYNEKLSAVDFGKLSWLLVNEVEASQLLRCAADGDPEQMLAQLHERYPNAMIVLTLGAQGALCAHGGAIHRQPAVPVNAVDTTAAGDTFTGYFLAGVLEGQNVPQALRYASAAAAIAVTQPGAAPSIPTRKKVLSSGAFCDILAE